MALVIQGNSSGMPPTGPLKPQGVPGNSRKNATSTKKKPSGQAAGFTFVDQSADLRSIADKKIVDSDQRHLIRSHVMQKVRKDERLQGKKRPTGRDGSRKASAPGVPDATSSMTPPKSERSDSTTPHQIMNWNSPPKSLSPVKNDCQQLVKVPHSPSEGTLDPFNTLPGGSEVAELVNNLMVYCFHSFIPQTYPIESSTPREYNTWRVKVLRSQSANSANFFGMMATVAAHQSIMMGRHRDLRPTQCGERRKDLLIDNDFALMKSHALQATQARISQNGWDGTTVEAIFALIGAETMVGNFDEARFHLSALRKFFVEGKGLDPASPASDWIPLQDVKSALGTMSRPLFRLPWEPEPLPQETVDKLFNWDCPEIALMGTAFSFVPGLGMQMQTILQQAGMLCRFCQFNATRNHELTAKEYELFRRKCLELEYDVLSYIYPGSPSDDNQVPNNISLIEQIARVVLLGVTSSLIVKILPSSGCGRALTHFQNEACQNFYLSLEQPPDRITAQYMVWALMGFAQYAYKQPEERHFIANIAWYSRWAGIDSWDTLEIVCSSFLYVPAFQRKLWQQVWGKACLFSQAGRKTMISLPSRPQAQHGISQTHEIRDYT